MEGNVELLYKHMKSLELYDCQGLLQKNKMERYEIMLDQFVSSSDNIFHFDPSCSLETVLLLIQHLERAIPMDTEVSGVPIMNLVLVFKSLQALRILSRDSKLVQRMGEKTYSKLVRFTFLMDEQGKDTISDEMAALAHRIVEESLKFFCNLAYHSGPVRKYLTSQRYSQTLLSMAQKRIDEGHFGESDIFCMRLLFLLSALEVQERLNIRNDYHGISILCDCLATALQSDVSSPNDIGSASEGKKPLPSFESRITCEILKALFNVTVGISDSRVNDSDLVCECGHLMSQLLHIFTTFELEYSRSDNVFTHAANLLLNMPKESFTTFAPLTEESSSTESQRASEGILFQGYNMTAVNCLLEGLKCRLCAESSLAKTELLPSLLSCLSYMCRLNKPVRKFIRFQVLPPLRDASKRPEESSDLRGKLVQLMTDIDRNVKYLAADFLFVLCKENVDRLVKHTGYGNAAGFLASRGLMLGRNHEFTGDYSSSDEDSDTEEYKGIEDKIDPITGAIRKESENPLLGMTEEEKELEAEKLVNLIGQLSDMKVIQPMKVGEDGRPVELGENEIKDIMRKKLEDPKP